MSLGEKFASGEFSLKDAFPQRLKPLLICGSCGTAEAVPFQGKVEGVRFQGKVELMHYENSLCLGRFFISTV